MVQTWERRETPVWRAYATVQDLCGSRVLVDKTPHNADHPRFLEHAHAIFGREARYVHLVRHPYACIASGLELRRDMSGNPHVTWEEVENAYVRLQTNVRQFFDKHLAAAQGGSILQIRYEDLVREPTKMLSCVCELAGLDYQVGMDEPYENAESIASFEAANLLATTDPKLMRKKKIDAAQADKWRSIKPPQPLKEESAALARTYGYEL